MKILSFLLIINIALSSSNNKKLQNAEKLIKNLLKPRKLLEGEETQTIATTSINQNPLSAYTLSFSSNNPPPPPTYAKGRMIVHNTQQTINYPSFHSPAWQMNNYPQIYNPYYGHLWAHHPLHQTAYEYMPFGLHPFMFPSMGSYGMNPLGAMNPMFGSINPFMNSHSAAMGLANQSMPNMNMKNDQGPVEGEAENSEVKDDRRKLIKDQNGMMNMQQMSNMQNMQQMPNMQQMQPNFMNRNMPNMQQMPNMGNPMMNMQQMPNMQQMQPNFMNRNMQNMPNMGNPMAGMNLQNDVSFKNNKNGPTPPKDMNMESLANLSKKVL